MTERVLSRPKLRKAMGRTLQHVSLIALLLMGCRRTTPDDVHLGYLRQVTRSETTLTLVFTDGMTGYATCAEPACAKQLARAHEDLFTAARRGYEVAIRGPPTTHGILLHHYATYDVPKMGNSRTRPEQEGDIR